MSVQMLSVDEDEGEIRLDRWLRRRFPGLTQGALQKLCRTGQVRVDGARVEASARLAAGQVVRVPPIAPAPDRPAPRREEVDLRDAKDLRRMVLFEDASLVVLNKPAGLPVQGGPGITRHIDGMLDALRAGGSEDRPRLVHRIDRDTSGLLLVARTPGSAAKLAAAFRTRAVRKTYWAVVKGRPSPQDGLIDLPLARLGLGAGAVSVAAGRDDEDAASALTEYAVRDAAGRKMSWLELQPLTGRMHQLRVHCEALGCPILGDPKYGREQPHPDGFAEQLHLHARTLRFPHPKGGWVEVSAELPPHMKETFNSLGFSAGSTPAPKHHSG